jgi:hypothetical protein
MVRYLTNRSARNSTTAKARIVVERRAILKVCRPSGASRLSQLGQNAKSSLRADVFRFAPNIGRYAAAQFMGEFD